VASAITVIVECFIFSSIVQYTKGYIYSLHVHHLTSCHITDDLTFIPNCPIIPQKIVPQKIIHQKISYKKHFLKCNKQNKQILTTKEAKNMKITAENTLISGATFRCHAINFKGIVLRDWGRLQMGSLDRSEFRTIPLEVCF
jgi:hypothetical protein